MAFLFGLLHLTSKSVLDNSLALAADELEEQTTTTKQIYSTFPRGKYTPSSNVRTINTTQSIVPQTVVTQQYTTNTTMNTNTNQIEDSIYNPNYNQMVINNNLITKSRRTTVIQGDSRYNNVTNNTINNNNNRYNTNNTINNNNYTNNNNNRYNNILPSKPLPLPIPNIQYVSYNPIVNTKLMKQLNNSSVTVVCECLTSGFIDEFQLPCNSIGCIRLQNASLIQRWEQLQMEYFKWEERNEILKLNNFENEIKKLNNIQKDKMTKFKSNCHSQISKTRKLHKIIEDEFIKSKKQYVNNVKEKVLNILNILADPNPIHIQENMETFEKELRELDILLGNNKPLLKCFEVDMNPDPSYERNLKLLIYESCVLYI